MQALLSLDPISALNQGQALAGGDVIHSIQAPGAPGRHCGERAGVCEVEMADLSSAHLLGCPMGL